MIERLKKIQADMLNLLGVAITAALISVGNFIARMGYDFYSKGGSQSDMFAIIIVVSAVFGFFLCISLLMWCWRRYSKRKMSPAPATSSGYVPLEQA